MHDNSQNSYVSFAINIVTLISSGVGLLYFLGLTYFVIYLDSLGLDIEKVGITTEFLFYIPSLWALAYSVIFSFTTFLLAPCFKSLRVYIYNWIRSKEPFEKLLDLNPKIWLPFTFIVCIYILFSLSFHEAKHDGEKAKQSYLSQQEYDIRLIENNRELVFIYCGSRNCAGFDRKAKTIVYFPIDMSYEQKVDFSASETLKSP